MEDTLWHHLLTNEAVHTAVTSLVVALLGLVTGLLLKLLQDVRKIHEATNGATKLMQDEIAALRQALDEAKAALPTVQTTAIMSGEIARLRTELDRARHALVVAENTGYPRELHVP